MKKYSLKIAVILVLMATVLASCGKEFLNTDQTNAVDSTIAFRVPSDLVQGMHGVYFALSRAGFMGRNAVLFGDMNADKMNKRAAGDLTFVNIELYAFGDTEGTFDGTWLEGYRVVNFAQRVIEEGAKMLDEYQGNAAALSTIHTQMAEAHALRAFALFRLVNMFGLPYSAAARNTLAIIAEDRFIYADETPELSTVGEAYDLILLSINRAKTHFTSGDGSFRPFYMNLAAVHALEARVHLYMRNWQAAITSANAALTASGATIEMNRERFVAMWGQDAASAEDIFSIRVTLANWLQASSLATYFNTYGGSINHSFYNEFAANDMRRGLFVRHTTADPTFWRPMKHPNATSINNIRIFGAPEMHLIIAEAQTELGTDLGAARTALLQVARRNPAITTVAHLPDNQADLRTFIAEERARELFQEGHRWFDLRRTGALMTRPTDETRRDIVNYDVSRFVYPIPFREINIPGSKIQQRPNWQSYFPN